MEEARAMAKRENKEIEESSLSFNTLSESHTHTLTCANQRMIAITCVRRIQTHIYGHTISHPNIQT